MRYTKKMMVLVHAVLAGTGTTFGFVWDSLFGLIFGFLVSAVVQVALTPAAMERYLGPNPRGILSAAAFGIVASACSYGAAAAARGLYARGADARAVFAFLVSSTNMNLAVVIMFWTMLGWRFAFAEFFGGIVIIAIVTGGFSVLFRAGELAALRERFVADAPPERRAVVTECPLCAMDGEPEHAVVYAGTTYRCCGLKHARDFAADPERYAGEGSPDERPVLGIGALRKAATWSAIADTALGDVAMLRNELILGYVVAGFAAALVPRVWLSGLLHAVGALPVIGYASLLVVGLLLAVATFTCSMGNVPIARYLALAGIPLGANTTFIYGDLLIAPLIGIYRKSFPPRVAWTFLGLFTVGALVAGALVDAIIGRGGEAPMAMTAINGRFTVAANVVALVALAAVVLAARAGRGAPAASRSPASAA